MRAILCSGLALLAASGAAAADDIFHLDGRIRFETADFSGNANTAEALSWRNRLGAEFSFGQGWSVLVEGEHVFHLIDDFNDTVNGQTQFPVIADPEATELNRLQLAHASDGRSFVLGRQRMVIGDSRYVGNVGYRQNEQTFDAVRLDFETAGGIEFGYAYLDRVHRIFGDDSPAGEWDLDTHLVTASSALGAGTLSFTGLWFENQDVPGMSSQTLAIQWSHVHALESGQFDYYVEFANQTDYGNATGPGYDLSALRLQLRMRGERFGGWVGLESLDGNGMRGFATPLATLHKFQGFADVFLGTPANGIRDVYFGGSAGFGDGALFSNRSVNVVWHHFEAENGGADFGSELNIVFNGRVTERVGFQLKYADFDGATGGPVSRERLALALSYSY